MNGLDLARNTLLSPTPVEARQEIQSLLESSDWRGDVDEVVLAVHEALTNALRHGGGITSAVAALHGQELLVEVKDAGPPFDPNRHTRRPPDPLAERGRGLWLISQIAASWELHRRRGYNCLRLRFAP